MRKNYFLFILALIATVGANAQDYWKTYNKKDGLVDSVVVDIAVGDNKVFIATPRGFSVFENNRFINFDTLNSSLPSQNIKKVRQFNDTAYLVTDSGLTQYASGRMIHFNVDSGLLSNRINDIEIDSKGVVWIASSAGLSRKNGNSFLNDPSRVIFDIGINSGDSIYANVFNSTIVNLPTPATAEVFDGTVWSELRDLTLTDFIQSAQFINLSNGGLGITSNNVGAFQINNLFDLTNLSIPNDRLNATFLSDMEIDAKGNYWFSFSSPSNQNGGGLIKFDGTNYTYFTAGLPVKNVRTIVAKDELIYIGTGQGFSVANDTIVSIPSAFTLETSEISTIINSNGILFNDQINNLSGFEFPKGSGRSTIYSSGLWVSGYNSQNEGLLAIQQFNAGDYTEGTINNNGAAVSPSMIKITKGEVDFHLANYKSTGYQMAQNIKSWPANGRVGLGEAEDQAPFIDANGNGCYDPENGDYPAILGDECIYLVINDAQQTTTGRFTPNFNLEAQIMIYVYNQPNIDYLNKTVFTRYTLINRSNETYNGVRTGFFFDHDIGAAFDDAVGCDPASDIFYAYNFDEIDDIAFSLPSYDTIIPFAGTKFINTDLDGYMGYDNVGGTTQDDAFPIVGNHFFKAMNMRWTDSLPITVGGDGYNLTQTNETKFRYSGDPRKTNEWSMLNPGANYPPNVSGDVRSLAMIPSYDFVPGERKVIDLVTGVGYDSANVRNRLAHYPLLISTLNKAAKFQQGVDSISPKPTFSSCITGISENKTNDNVEDFVIYPNPTNGELNVVANSKIVEVFVYDIQGKLVSNQKNQPSVIQKVDLDDGLQNGLYFLRVVTVENKQLSKQFLLQR